MTLTIKSCLTHATSTLKAQGFDTFALDAQLLLAHCLQVTRAYLYAHGEKQLGVHQYQEFRALLARRLSGEPMAYLLQCQEFWSLNFYVNEDVLIPRADTEVLVAHALNVIPKNLDCVVVDAGTGSGAIALSVVHERPKCNMFAIDASAEALAVARKNSAALDKPCTLLQTSWLNAFADKSVDVVVSNPPYIGESEVLAGDVLCEPRSALFAGQQGLEDIQRLIYQGVRVLKPHGFLLIEHGWQQASAVRAMLDAMEYCNISSETDLAGHERISMAQRI